MTDRYVWQVSLVTGLLASATMSCATPPSLPPPPVLRHTINPQWRTVETVYHCPDGERRFSVRYANSQIIFLGGVRKGIQLPAGEVERATEALRQLDSVSDLYPQCSEPFDTIMAVGRIGARRMAVFLVWAQDRLQLSAPESIGN